MNTQAISFVDVETTGSRVTYDRIIEIGILRVEKGTVKKTYSTLINPNCYVSPFIEEITGIKSADLETAPLFEKVAQEIYDTLKGSLFVAHNVRFDYGFLRNEFRRLGIPLSLKHFCSVKLSRLLFPKEKHHNLDSIIERFNIACTNRHRAFDDAQVVWDFYQKIHNLFPTETIDTHLQRLLKKPTLPRYLSEKDLENLPESPGVYVFYGENEVPLYVGKSVNIRERVLSHFSSDYTNTKEMNMCQQIERIDTVPTAGELGALLRETELIKKLQPLYNRQLRLHRDLYFLKSERNKKGYETVSLHSTDELDPKELDRALGIFRSRRQAKDFLRNLLKTHGLCEKFLGLEKSKGPCFSSKLGYCRGACRGLEKTLKYNLRFYEAFAKSKIKSWPFKGPVTIREKDEFGQKMEEFTIDNWCLVEGSNRFDYDTYKILVRYILDGHNMKRIHTRDMKRSSNYGTIEEYQAEYL